MYPLLETPRLNQTIRSEMIEAYALKKIRQKLLAFQKRNLKPVSKLTFVMVCCREETKPRMN